MALKTWRDLYWATREELERPEMMGIREAIRVFRREAAEQILAAMPPGSEHAKAVAHARDAAQRLEQAVEVAKEDDSDDPFWSKPRAALVEFGGAAAKLVLVDKDARGGDAEWLEFATELNGPDRVNAFVGGTLWRTLVGFYLDQVEGAGDLDGYLSSLSLVQIAIEQVGQIDSIEPDH